MEFRRQKINHCVDKSRRYERVSVNQFTVELLWSLQSSYVRETLVIVELRWYQDSHSEPQTKNERLHSRNDNGGCNCWMAKDDACFGVISFKRFKKITFDGHENF